MVKCSALAIEYSRKDGKRLGVKALKIAISKYLQTNKPDFSKCRFCFGHFFYFCFCRLMCLTRNIIDQGAICHKFS
jgi:hypothetical protein